MLPKAKAQREAGWSGDFATVWERGTHLNDGSGFLLVRWKGLEIDYGHVVRTFALPDGSIGTGFCHPDPNREPWSLLDGAIWWSTAKLPAALRGMGVVEADDQFSRDWIQDAT